MKSSELNAIFFFLVIIACASSGTNHENIRRRLAICDPPCNITSDEPFCYDIDDDRGAERLLKENKGNLKLRFEFDEGLLKAAGTTPSDVLKFLEELGYKVAERQGDDMDWN